MTDDGQRGMSMYLPLLFLTCSVRASSPVEALDSRLREEGSEQRAAPKRANQTLEKVDDLQYLDFVSVEEVTFAEQQMAHVHDSAKMA